MERSLAEGKGLTQAVGGTAVQLVEFRYVLEQNHKLLLSHELRLAECWMLVRASLKIEQNCSTIEGEGQRTPAQREGHRETEDYSLTAGIPSAASGASVHFISVSDTRL